MAEAAGATSALRPFERLAALPSSKWFAYPVLLAVQARAMWGLWDKDLTSGDTAGYAAQAWLWPHDLQVHFAWSPLYTAFYGTINWLAGGNFVTGTLLHRAIIVLVLALGVLALFRRLLPPAIALLMACWWAVLPINFDSLYEVHLFAVLPLLGAALLLTDEPGPWRRGAALGLLVACAALVRNEAILVAAALGVAFAVSEWSRRRAGAGTPNRRLLLAFGAPLAIAATLVSLAYARSVVQGDRLRQVLSDKHTLNVCQVYAANYGQRHPDRFPGNPFTECRPLMVNVFGERQPGLLEAWSKNPKAMIAFTAWNAWLVPDGLEVGLFNAAWGDDNPDYVPTTSLKQWYVAPLSLLLLAVLAAGAVRLWRDREAWSPRLRPQRWAWFALVVLALVGVLLIVALERPRPSYMFALTIGIMAAAGLALAALVRGRAAERWLATAGVAVPVLLVALLPRHYHASTPRPLTHMYQRLEPVAQRLTSGTVVVPGYEGEACSYLAPRRPCRSAPFAALAAEATGGKSLSSVFQARDVQVFYADPATAASPVAAKLLQDPRAAGLRVARSGRDTGGRWAVLVRDEAQPGAPSRR
jgi:hypothetical protein